MTRERRQSTLVLFLGLTGLLLASCSRQTTEVSPPVSVPDSFSRTGIGNGEPPDRWWTAFGDAHLDSLVERALHDNLDLETAWHRLREAQAIAGIESSALYPDLTASFQGQASTGEAGGEEFEDEQQFRLGLSSTYEVDLWGRIRSAVDAERARARASLADYQTVALTVAAEVARSWYRLREARNQGRLIAAQADANEQVLRLLRARFGSGQTRSVDILRQNQLVESTREERIAAESRAQVLEHRLAVLLGVPAQALAIEAPADSLPAPPPTPPTGLPAELVRRRPDVRSAYERLHAADRDLAAAISNRYPRLTLTASISTASENAGNLFDDWITAVAGDLLAPLFTGGELSSEVDRSEAVKHQRLSSYGQATLIAFQEVEDALIQEETQRERIQSLELQVEFAQQAYEQLRLEFFNGMSDYLDVLVALTEEQELRRELLASYLLLLEYRIALYRALAGGFETPRQAALSEPQVP